MFRLTSAAGKSSRSIIVTAVVSASALICAAVPAAAFTVPRGGGPSYHCRLFASEPRLSARGHEITGGARSLCTGTGWQDQQLTVSVQEHDFPTLYIVRAKASTAFSSSHVLRQRVSWNCTGVGTRLYTVEASWYGRNGTVHSFTYPPKTISITCAS